MQKKHTFVSTLLIGLVGLATLTGTAHANRWASLRQNQLIEDKDNVFLFPQLLLDYRNDISFDYGSGTAPGNAEYNGRVLYLGGWKEFGLGMSAFYGLISPAHTGTIPLDLLSQETENLYLGDLLASNPFPVYSVGLLETPPPDLPFTLVDAFMALPIGIGTFGARVGLGTRGAYTTTDNNDQGSDETLLALEAGLSGKGSVRWDTSLNLTFDFYGEKDEVAENEGSDTLIRASLSGRCYLPLAKKVDVGLLGNLVLNTAGFTDKDLAADTEDKSSSLGFGVMAGAGPVFRISPRISVGGYGLLGIATASLNGPANNDTVSDLLIFIPAVRIAADIGITDWFFFRTGIQYAFQLSSTSRDDNAQVGTTDYDSANRRTGTLGWSTGIGFAYEGFTLDGTLAQDFMTNGPDFIGGDTSALFAVVTAGYHWL